MQHLKYGGSTAARTIGCAAWQKLSEDVPKGAGPNPAADQGTMLHNCMEELYQDDNELTPESLLAEGRSYNDEHLTQELIDTKLLPAIEAVEKLLDTYDAGYWVTEPFVKIDDDMGGSIDLLAFNTDTKTVVVVDYKFGFHDVAALNNKQAQFYALAAATDPATRDWFDAVETVVIVIIQPNENGDVTDIWEIDMDQIDTFETEYLAAVEKSEEPDPVPTPGDWCKYCPAEATECSAKNGLALKATRVTELTADKLAEYLPMAIELKAWIKAVEKMAHEQLELNPNAIKGFKLVPKRASRVWNDQPAVEKKVRLAKKLKLEDGFKYELKSPTQLEKVCKTKGVDFKKQYAQYVSAVSSGTTLAPESDPRSAALPVAGLEQLNALND